MNQMNKLHVQKKGSKFYVQVFAHEFELEFPKIENPVKTVKKSKGKKLNNK